MHGVTDRRVRDACPGRVSAASRRRPAGARATALSEWCGHGPDSRGRHRARQHRARPDRATRRMFLAAGRPGRRAGAGRGRAGLLPRRASSSATCRSSSCPTATSASPSCGSSCSAPASISCSTRCTASSHAELAGIAAKAAQGVPVPRAPHRRVGAAPGRRHRGESRAGAGGARRAVALDRRVLVAGRGGSRARGREGISRRPRDARARVGGDGARAARSARRCAVPDAPMRMTGGRQGRHTEHLGHMLAEMQIVARTHPGAKW